MDFDRLYGLYSNYTFKIMYSIIRNVETAMDLNQDLWLKVHLTLDDVLEKSTPKAWLTVVAKNIALNFKKRKYSKRLLERELFNNDLSYSHDFDTKIYLDNVLKFVSELPDRQKMSYYKFTYEGKTFYEIGREMDCCYDTAKANARHARIKVREEFD